MVCSRSGHGLYHSRYGRLKGLRGNIAVSTRPEDECKEICFLTKDDYVQFLTL